MKYTATLGLLLALGIACVAQSSAPKADDVLKAYSQRVQDSLLPRANELTYEQILDSIDATATEMLVPNKELLFEKAKSELARLPKLTVDLTDGWDTVTEAKGQVTEADFFSASSQPQSRPASREGIRFAYSWNPTMLANVIKSRITVGRIGPEDYGRRAMIEGLAWPIYYARSADPQRPVIAIETGPELFVIHLKRIDAGYYVSEKVQWLRKKGTTSHPATATSHE